MMTSFLAACDVSGLMVAITCMLVAARIVHQFVGGQTERLPPGPRKIPFPLNMIATYFERESRMELLISSKKTYGDLVLVDIDGEPVVLVSSAKLARELFVKRSEITADRPNIKLMKEMIKYTGGIVFTHYRQQLRRFALSSLRNFGMGKRNIEPTITNEARKLLDILSEGQPIECVNPGDFINCAVSNIICSITFGKVYEYRDPEFVSMMYQINTLFGRPPAPPFLRLLFFRFPALIHVTPAGRHAVGIKAFIKQHVTEHEATFDPNDIRDMIDVFIAEDRRLVANEGAAYFDKSDIWMCVFELFFAGTETTSTALKWFFLLMAGHPDIQAKVIQEIDSVIGQERAPAYEDRKQMPFTEATLTEVLRFRPVVPSSVAHTCNANLSVGNHVIPAGSVLRVNILAIHHDPETFPHPDRFDPARFLSADQREFVKNDAYLPFGLGPRSCLGEQLAKMEFFLFATSVLQRCLIRLPAGASPDYSISHCVQTLLPKDFRVKLVKR